MATFDFDFIFVETVGVGQSESDITKLADFSILTLAPGLGDSIQAMKGGVLEIVDLILVNKSDKPESAQTFNQLKSIIDMAQTPEGKNIKIMITNEKDREQNTKIITHIEKYLEKRLKLGKNKESYLWFVRQILYEKIEKSLFDQKIHAFAVILFNTGFWLELNMLTKAGDMLPILVSVNQPKLGLRSFLFNKLLARSFSTPNHSRVSPIITIPPLLIILSAIFPMRGFANKPEVGSDKPHSTDKQILSSPN